MNAVYACEIEFIKALHFATLRKVIAWRVSDDDVDDMFTAYVGEQAITIEILYLPNESGAERLMYRVVGLGVWLRFAAGTEGFGYVGDMLSKSIDGWSAGQDAAIDAIVKATDAVCSLTKSSGSSTTVHSCQPTQPATNENH